MADPPPAYAQQQTGYQPAVYPPSDKPGAYPPPQQPTAYPPQQQPGYPPQQQPGYPPQQQPGYPPQQQTAATTVVLTQPTVTVQQQIFRDRPLTVVDSNGQQVQTVLDYRTGMLTWLVCCLVCWITGCWCLALIPFCIDATKDVYHITPSDGKIVGIYKRI